jgi:3-oxoacyl-[acyl-carrier protein] reductase/pteridine reductase
VRSEASVGSAVTAVVGRFGRLDLVVNNAAVFESAPLDSLTLDQWNVVFETNARGPFLVAREALPHLRAAEGRIVNIGSLGGIHAWAGHAHYCASKAALHMLTQAMAKAFAPEVSVNCVAPGWIELDGEENGRGSGQAAHFAAKTPMRRNGNVEDVAQAVLFFAAGPHFVTGQVLTVDGGLGL